MSIRKLIAGRWGARADQYDDIKTDAATNAIAMLEYEHYQVHNGSSFKAHFSNTTANADDHRSAIGFSMPNTTKWIHLIIEVSASHPAEVFIEEAPTIDNGAGTEQTIYNRNRNDATTSTVVSLAGAPAAGEVTTFLEAQIAAANFVAGTILEHLILAGGQGPKAVGGVSRGSQEWILDQGVKYLIRMQNIGATINTHHLHLGWYEHVRLH